MTWVPLALIHFMTPWMEDALKFSEFDFIVRRYTPTTMSLAFSSSNPAIRNTLSAMKPFLVLLDSTIADIRFSGTCSKLALSSAISSFDAPSNFSGVPLHVLHQRGELRVGGGPVPVDYGPTAPVVLPLLPLDDLPFLPGPVDELFVPPSVAGEEPLEPRVPLHRGDDVAAGLAEGLEEIVVQGYENQGLGG